MHGFSGMGWGMGFGWILGPLVLGVLIWVIVRFVNQSNESGRPGGNSALDILKERYARGEISKEEFEAKKRDLI